MMASPWTPQEDNQLWELVRADAPKQRIMEALPRRSWNAIKSRIYRLRDRWVKPEEGRKPAGGDTAPAKLLTRSIMRAVQGCQWPKDPWRRPYRFCGEKTSSDRPYCDTHCRLAYQPPRS